MTFLKLLGAFFELAKVLISIPFAYRMHPCAKNYGYGDFLSKKDLGLFIILLCMNIFTTSEQNNNTALLTMFIYINVGVYWG